MDALPTERLLELHRHLVLNRLLEERLVRLYRQGKLAGGMYRSLGQEATSVGSAFALEDGDLLSPLIRNLGSVLVRGVTPRQVLLQYLARADAPSRGKEAILHVSVPERGVYAPTAMLGTMVPVMAGMVLAERLVGRPTVALTYVGDGASSVGAFHEGLNFAAVQRLPLVVVLEYNRWAYSTPSEKQCAAAAFADKAAGYGLPAEIVDGNDVLSVHDACRRAVERARSGEGPTLVEARTYRLKGHAEHDGQAYVDPEELETWRRRDPIARFERLLGERGLLDAGQAGRVREEIGASLDADVEAALASPLPDPASLQTGVFAPDGGGRA